MNKAYVGVAVIVALGLGLIGYSLFSKAKLGSEKKPGLAYIPEQKGFDGKVRYEFVDLGGKLIAKAGEYSVTKQEVESSAPMRSFLNKKRDLLFALIYKQKVSFAETTPKKIEFSFKKLSRSPSAILNQYGIPVKAAVHIQFDAFDESKGLARVEGSYVPSSEVDYNNFIWADYETDMFRFKLAELDKRLKRKVVDGEAKKLGIRRDAYEKEYIYSKLPEEISENDIKAYLDRYSFADNAVNRSKAQRNLLQARQRRGYDYVLERYVMELPIQVDLEQPVHRLEAKAEWTPFWGNPDAPLKVTLFTDTLGQVAKSLINDLVPVLNRYNGVQFLFRPINPNNSGIQQTISMMHFCVWMKHQDRFWDFFLSTLGPLENAEKTMYQVASDQGLDEQSLKQCLVSQQFKEVVDYHNQYASYLGVTIGPVMYVGGEVLSGAITAQDVEKVIQRQLEVPAAGSW